MNEKALTPHVGEVLIYKTDDGKLKLDVRLEEETVWLTQAHMTELFQVKPQNITMHLKNIYAEGELLEEATCKEFLQVQVEGGREVERKRKFYNLDAIISLKSGKAKLLKGPPWGIISIYDTSVLSFYQNIGVHFFQPTSARLRTMLMDMMFVLHMAIAFRVPRDFF